MTNFSKNMKRGQSMASLGACLLIWVFVAGLAGCGGMRPAGGEPVPATAKGEAVPNAAPPGGITAPDLARPLDTSPWVPGQIRPLAVVRPGIDVLLGDDFEALRGKRVGLITNHTGTNAAGESSIDLLHNAPGVRLVALFGPEHGIRGVVEAGEKVASGRDEATGLPIYSLYGETRKPTAAMLKDLDALVFDIQDIGTRYYTYVWTMALALQAAGEQGLEFVVLDRPNPLGGVGVQGNVLEPARASFVGLYPVPMRHGLTAGELARLLNGEYGFGAKLTVVRAEGWRREAWFDQTGLPWTAPSPNMPSLESALHYPGTCLFEGTNLSVGRGTPQAFQQIGAPWLDNEEVARRLNARGLAGVRFVPVTFTPDRPGDGRFGGQVVRGIRLEATDRAAYDPAVAAIALLVEIQALHADRLTWAVSHFDRLAGTDRIRKEIVAGAGVAEITAGWAAELARFEGVREKYLLYP
jgi:uncharacterized protein YbbC (DUF1343 family)